MPVQWLRSRRADCRTADVGDAWKVGTLVRFCIRRPSHINDSFVFHRLVAMMNLLAVFHAKFAWLVHTLGFIIFPDVVATCW